MSRAGQPLSFADTRALIIGATGGIGSATRDALGAAGADVLCVDTPQAAAKSPSEWAFWPADLDQSGAARTAVEDAWAARGPIDVLVHAAGIFPAQHALVGDEELFDTVMRVNTRSVMSATSALARLCAESGTTASVVVVSSGAADRPRPGTAVYAASKAALNAVVRGLALEFLPLGVRVNAVAPGFVDVASELNPVPERYVEAVSRDSPSGRAAVAADIVPSLLWLAHDASYWVTGQILHTDGGAGLGSTEAASWLST